MYWCYYHWHGKKKSCLVSVFLEILCYCYMNPKRSQLSFPIEKSHLSFFPIIIIIHVFWISLVKRNSLLFSLLLSKSFFTMADARTSDLPVWDPVPPTIHPTHSFDFEIRADIPLLAQTWTHICGLATGEISTQFLYFFLLISLNNIGLLFIDEFSMILLKEIWLNCENLWKIKKIKKLNLGADMKRW